MERGDGEGEREYLLLPLEEGLWSGVKEGEEAGARARARARGQGSHGDGVGEERRTKWRSHFENPKMPREGGRARSVYFERFRSRDVTRRRF